MENKKVVIICSIIAVIIVLSIIGFKIKNMREQVQPTGQEDITSETDEVVSQNEIQEEENETNENEINENIIDENEINENEINTNRIEQESKKEENKLVESTTSTKNNDNIIGQEEINTEEESKNNTNTENNEKKALSLVKEEWGEDDSVYYTIDNQSGNLYNISVRSKSTTATLAEYEVNVEEETVIII